MFMHTCLNYNVLPIKTVSLRDSSGGRAIFHEFMFDTGVQYVFLIVYHSSSTHSSRQTSQISLYFWILNL